jgi:hypothetical protein
MGLFNRRVNVDKAREFFTMAVATILSEEEHNNNLKRLDELIAKVPVLKSCDKEKFDTQLTAVNLVLMYSAWNLWCYKKIKSFVHDGLTLVEDSLETNQAVKGYRYSIDYYKDISGYHGPEVPSGTTAIAQQFVKSITKSKRLPDPSDELVQTFRYLFDGTLESYTTDFKRLKLIR